MDDPILLIATAFSLLAIPGLSILVGKINPKFVYIPPSIAMIIAFPIFLLLVIIQGAPISLLLLRISLSLWTGGFFGIFISIFLYIWMKKKKRNT